MWRIRGRFCWILRGEGGEEKGGGYEGEEKGGEGKENGAGVLSGNLKGGLTFGLVVLWVLVCLL